MNTRLFDKDIFRKAFRAFLRGNRTQHDEVLVDVEAWMASGKPGLLLMGTVGTGKTTIAHALRCAWVHYLTVARVYSCDWIASQVEADKSWTREIAGEKGLVILDDLGTEKRVYGEEVLPQIIYARYARGQYTVITTNLTLEQIRSRYGERIADRLRTYSRIVMNYNSLRK